MLNLKALALTALVTLTALGGAAEARPSRNHCWEADNGSENCWTRIGRNSMEFSIDNRYDGTGFIALMNCSTGELKTRAVDGYSTGAIRGQLEYVCSINK